MNDENENKLYRIILAAEIEAVENNIFESTLEDLISAQSLPQAFFAAGDICNQINQKSDGTIRYFVKDVSVKEGVFF